jgi:chromosome segregation ATPase
MMWRAMIGVLIVCMAAAPAGLAQTERSGNADARVMQQMQQLSAERVALKAENDRLKLELEQAKAELSKASAGKAAIENRARSLEANASRGDASAKQAQEQLERTRGQMQELVVKFRETAQTLRDVETERAGLKSQLALREREQKVCVDRNVGLYQLNSEILDRMENRGFWSSLAEREPFTRLKRVELENLIEDYRYRAQELQLESQRRAQAEKAGEK